jgi:uncharacterized protein YxjI
MQYPLTLSFKILALAPQITVTDGGGNPVMYVRQKLFKLKEQIHVYRDDSKSQELFQINADRIIDFSANYRFTTATGDAVGSVKRRGARSLWKASYDVADSQGQAVLNIEEESAWVKFLDGLLGEIPILGAFTGYFLNPTYAIRRPGNGEVVLKVVKHRSFLESKFEIQRQDEALGGGEEIAAVLAVLMMVLLERQRG